MALSILAALALLTGAGPGPQHSTDPYTPFRGRPVASIELLAPTSEEPEELLNLVDIEPGYLLEAKHIQDSIKRLYTLGRFANVDVFIRRVGPSLEVTFRLLPIARLDRIDFVGCSDCDTKALRAALKLNPGDEIDRRTSANLRRAARTFLHETGYPSAQVEVQRQDDREDATAAFTLNIVPGPPQQIAAVRFVGPIKVKPNVLKRELKSRLGSTLNRPRLQQDRKRLLNAYVSRGFRRATVGEPQIHLDPTGRQATVVFAINPGPRIAITYGATPLLSQTTMKSLWPDPSGRMREGDLDVVKHRLEQRLRGLGYADAKVEHHSAYNPSLDHERHLFVVRSGPPVRVASVDFEGVTVLNADRMQSHIRAELEKSDLLDANLMPLHPGEATAINRGGQSKQMPRGVVPSHARWLPDTYNAAMEWIGQQYLDRGYLAAQVGPVRTQRVGDRLRVTIPVTEGEQTRTTAIGFQGNTSVNSTVLMGIVAGTPPTRGLFGASDDGNPAILALGAPLSPQRLEDARIGILGHYRNAGFLYAKVDSNIVPSKAAATTSSSTAKGKAAEVYFAIDEGPQVRVQRTLVRGNRYTREGIVRSHITFKPNDVYRVEQALEIQRSISNLGVFSSVRVKLIDEEVPAEHKDLVTEVTERNRQPVELAPGISTSEGPRIRASYSHINLFGTATALTAALKINRQIFFGLFGDFADVLRSRYNEEWTGVEQLTKAIEREARLGIRTAPIKPLWFDPSFRLDLVNERENTIPYSLDTFAAIFGADLTISDELRLSIEPQLSWTDLECTQDCDLVSSEVQRLRQQSIDNGRRLMWKIGPSLTYDLRDNPISPRRGLVATIRAAYAGGQQQRPPSQAFTSFSFAKAEGRLTGYIPLQDATLALSVQAGSIFIFNPQVPIDERFYLGGRDSLRGYVERTLIPEDACVVDNAEAALPAGCEEAIIRPDDGPAVSRGGNGFVLVKAELRLPVTERISLGLFVDAGNLWLAFPDRDELILRVGTGAGLRYATPVGDLTVDLGFNPGTTRADEPRGLQVHVSIGNF